MTLAVLSEITLPGDDFSLLPSVEIAGAGLTSTRPDDVGALIVVHERVDEAVLNRFPRLRVVARFGIGYDSVDVAACTARGVQVSITPGPVDQATAELTIALMLAAQWEIPRWDAETRAGGWAEPMSQLPPNPGLYGARVGLLGVGRVGFEVARRLVVLGSTVSYVTRSPNARADSIGAIRGDFDAVLAASDILSVHLPLNSETRGFLGKRELSLLPDGALVVNTARGPVIDEGALLAELATGRLRAALDVFWDGPRIPRAYLDSSRAILTPHIGSRTRRARIEMTSLVVGNVLAALEGRLVPNPVAEQLSWRPA